MPNLVFSDIRPHSFIDADGTETVTKDPARVDIYTLDWSKDLGSSETISTSTWVSEGATLSAPGDTDTTTTTTVTGSGGAKNTVVTSAGRTLVHRVKFVDVLE